MVLLVLLLVLLVLLVLLMAVSPTIEVGGTCRVKKCSVFFANGRTGPIP